MDSTDAAGLIAELHESKAEHEAADRFRNRGALLVAVLAATLAIGGLGGGNATDDLIGYSIRANDAWAFYQAKNIRQTAYSLAADELEAELGRVPAEERAAAEQRLARYRATIDRYDSEPHASGDPLKGEGKKELLVQAQAHEEARDRAAEQGANFDLAEVALQLALVLASVAILAVNRSILILATFLGVIGSVLTLNGFLLIAPLSF